MMVFGISIIGIMTIIYNYDQGYKLPERYMNTEYDIQKCDELLAIGFFAKVGKLKSEWQNTLEDQQDYYDLCINYVNHINS